MSRRALLAVAALCASRFALAQQTPAAPPAQPPTPGPGPLLDWTATPPEDAADRNAANLYEDALRAETLGKKMLAQQLAQQALDASPHGRYSPAVGRLLDRLASETLMQQPIRTPDTVVPPLETSTPAPSGGEPDAALGSRVAYIVSGGLLGGAAGALFGGATPGNSGSGIAGFGLAGAVLGVGLTAATLSFVHDGSMPTHLWSGGIFGAFAATGALLLVGPGPSSNTVAGLIGAGLSAGAIVGAVLGGVTDLTGGDGAAGLVLGSLLVGEVLLIEGSDIVATNPSTSTASQVVGGTTLALTLVGFIGGELLNHQIHWSGGRWGLVFLSAFLGAGLAGLVAGISNSGASAALGLIAAGNAVGFGAGCVATMGMSPESVSRGTASPSGGEFQGMSRPAIPRAAFAWTF